MLNRRIRIRDIAHQRIVNTDILNREIVKRELNRWMD